MKVLVTGGGGFLGSAIAARLFARGDEVVSLARGAYPELEARGARSLRGDLADADTVRAAARGCALVFHVAAKAGVFGAPADYHRTNVVGTRNVIEACRAEGVPRLVFTSSPSVCFDGRDHRRAGPDLPYATRFLAPYPASKAEAERAVLAASGAELATCALRPHLIFGPGDPHLLPRLLERARRRRLAIVGAGTNEVSLTYVDNAAAAHLAAADALVPDAPCAGRAYFIAQEEPVRLWAWIDALLARLDLPRVTRRVPFPIAHAAGAACELAWRALRLSGEPPMTRFVAAQLARSHSYDLAPARADLGYREEVAMAEATERLVAHLRAAGA